MYMLKQPSFSETTLKQVLENISTSIFLLNKDLEVIYINNASEMLFEISLRKAVGVSFRKLLSEPRDLIARLSEALASESSFAERELLVKINGARAVTVNCTANTIIDPVTRANAILVEFLQVDRQIKIAREGALLSQQKMTQKLLRGLSHEIKNPLGGIRGAAQLLERELEDEQLKEYTSVVIKETDRLKNLVDRMLGPKHVLNQKWVNVHEILERVYSLVHAEVPEIRIERDYDPSIPPLYLDEEQMIQALLNLVRNAVDAVRQNERPYIVMRSRINRKFTIGSVQHKLVTMLDIVDNGVGVSEDISDKIFFPMITDKDTGTGLGLSISQSIVNHHGGLIEFESRPGLTQFHVILPLESSNENGK